MLFAPQDTQLENFIHFVLFVKIILFRFVLLVILKNLFISYWEWFLIFDNLSINQWKKNFFSVESFVLLLEELKHFTVWNISIISKFVVHKNYCGIQNLLYIPVGRSIQAKTSGAEFQVETSNYFFLPQQKPRSQWTEKMSRNPLQTNETWKRSLSRKLHTVSPGRISSSFSNNFQMVSLCNGNIASPHSSLAWRMSNIEATCWITPAKRQLAEMIAIA